MKKIPTCEDCLYYERFGYVCAWSHANGYLSMKIMPDTRACRYFQYMLPDGGAA